LTGNRRLEEFAASHRLIDAAGGTALVPLRLEEQLTLATRVLTACAASATSILDRSRQAVDSREAIAKATGLLMHEHRLTQDAALEVLRRRASSANRTVREIAVEMVDAADNVGLDLRPAADC
jgi:AmiR/NasT family two-component response regulator